MQPPNVTCAGLKRLVGLSVPNNRLESFPPALCSLPGIIVLDLSGNRLRALPDMITTLTSLKSLRISSNDIVAVPAGLTALSALVGFSTRENPVSEGVEQPHARSREDVLKLLRELLARGADATAAAAACEHPLLCSMVHAS